MQKYFYDIEQLKEINIKYILSIGKRQPMHIGHKRSLARILSIKEMRLIYVIGSANLADDPLFDPITNPLTVEQQIQQFKIAFPNEQVIFLPIIDVEDMSKWGPSIIASLADLSITPEECAIHFIGKSEDKLLQENSFFLPSGEKVTLNPGQWLIEALGYYNFAIWFDNIEVDLSISARNLRQLDLENLNPEQEGLLATPNYLLELAVIARNNNPNKDKLKDHPITLYDLSLERARATKFFSEVVIQSPSSLKRIGRRIQKYIY